MSIDAEQMDGLTRGLPSKSAKIRKLADTGVARADIARFLRVRYQFVRNVLVAQEAKRSSSETSHDPKTGGEDGRLLPVRVSVGPGGTIVLPEMLRSTLDVKQGDSLIAFAEDGVLQIMTVPAAVRRAQAMVRRYVPAGASLVDDLLRDRSAEVRRERARD